MPLSKITKLPYTDIIAAILNSYSIIFFLDNKVLSTIILIVSFFNFWAGLSGLFAVIIALTIGFLMHIDKQSLKSGLFSFNALLVGIGMGTFFDPGVVYFTLLALATLLSLLLSVSFSGWLGKNKLPFLSIPFVISFWFIVLPSSHFENLGLTQRSIYWINEVYAIGGNQLLDIFQSIDNFKINTLVDIYLRSISSIFFQSNVVTGLLITLALLYSSRIMFTLSIVGFMSAYLFAQYTGSEAASINYYNIGANYMMIAFALGGYFTIPSKLSHIWVILLVPLTSLVLLFFFKLFSFIQLPVFSLPFAFVTILFLFFLQMRTKSNGLVLTPLQLNSPEKNLYTYNNNKNRLSSLYYFPLQLPFMGEWTVTQAHHGDFTHKGEWAEAFDFMITDSENKTYSNQGLELTDYYCFNKPVLATADGIVEIIVDSIDDNEIGQIDTVNNWGNSIVIRHTTGLYTQVSHLRKGTCKVTIGEFVTKGTLLANCGNSGRSPEPHLHFQAQYLPIVGARTMNYPFAYYYKRENDDLKLAQFDKPKVGDKLSTVSTESLIYNALNIFPDHTMTFNYTVNDSDEQNITWITYTDAYNQKYIYCKSTNSVAYYVNDGYMFYFTAFYGSKSSLLYYFFLSAYKIFQGENAKRSIHDSIALNLVPKTKPFAWLHDFIAPFYNIMHVDFQSSIFRSSLALNSGLVVYNSKVSFVVGNKTTTISNSELSISEKGIVGFEYSSKNNKIIAHV